MGVEPLGSVAGEEAMRVADEDTCDGVDGVVAGEALENRRER